MPRSRRWVERNGIVVRDLKYVRKELGVEPGPAEWRLGSEALPDLSGLDDDLRAALSAAAV